VLNEMVVMQSELERNGTKEVVAYFKAPSQHSADALRKSIYTSISLVSDLEKAQTRCLLNIG
jgi:hypothetical protein